MTHRLFFGIKPPRSFSSQLLDIMGGIQNARWQDDDQLHLTLRYIGEVGRDLANDLAEAAGRISFSPFEIRIEGCGAFDNKGVPRSLHATIAASEPLDRLRRKIERMCIAHGIAPESRKFLPHVTLTRLNRSSGSLDPFLAQYAGLELGPWQVEEFILYESHLRDEGSLYKPVTSYAAQPA